MSISYLTSPNSFEIYSKTITTENIKAATMEIQNFDTPSLSVETLTLTNKQTLILSLWGLSGFGWIEIRPLIEVTYRVIDKLIFIEIPEFNATIPNGINQLALSEEIFTNPTIAWPFLFKYDSINQTLGSVNGSADEILFTSLFKATNTGIYINRGYYVPYNPGPFIFYPIVLTLILA